MASALEDLETLIATPGASVPRAQLDAWMSAPEPEVRRAVFRLLQTPVVAEPPLDADVAMRWGWAWLERELREGDAPSAATLLAEWMRALFDAKRAVELQKFRDWVGRLYLSLPEGPRAALLTHALKPLNRHPGVTRLFAAWKREGQLAPVYLAARGG